MNLRKAAVALTALLVSLAPRAFSSPIAFLMAGEPTADSIVLQARIGESAELDFGSLASDIPGVAGEGWFEISDEPTFRQPARTDALTSQPTNDFILKTKVTGLRPGVGYYYRVIWSEAGRAAMLPGVGRFSTLPDPHSGVNASFVMVSCMNYEKFYGIGSTQTQSGATQWAGAAKGEDRAAGFPAFDMIRQLKPLFWIGNGDNVYYDSPTEQPHLRAKTVEQMRAKWHRQFAVPRVRAALAEFSTYWLKDDHDYRFNDADRTDRVLKEPSHEEGVRIFREQVAIVDPRNPHAKTYRTHRVSRDLQLWFLEGRDYRSPNHALSGPEKTLWGTEQRAWLQRSLLESDAAFRVIVSPTPLVGPDDASKRDNHVNPGGFRHEGEAFIEWLSEQNLIERVFILNGDRHWQYHSIHPSGLEEFSSGALNSQNARLGPANAKSTDPKGEIVQPYVQPVPIGGFLFVSVAPISGDGRPSILFQHWDERGDLLYSVRRYAPRANQSIRAFRIPK